MTATLSAQDSMQFDVRAWDGIAGFRSGALPDAAPSWIDTATPAHLRSDLPCQIADRDLWFSDAPAELEAAKARCAPCPLRGGCLSGALERREPWGVWGGEILERGVVIGRKRPRGRPRKDAA